METVAEGPPADTPAKSDEQASTAFKIPPLPPCLLSKEQPPEASPEHSNVSSGVAKGDRIKPTPEVEEKDEQQKSASKSAADAMNYYTPPDWALPCPRADRYQLEVIKNGTPLPEDTVFLSGIDHCIFGRQPRAFLNPHLRNTETGQTCVLLHPSLSRVHAVLQYGIGPKRGADSEAEEVDSGSSSSSPPGWFIYDLNSTHGTFVNKHRTPSHRYLRLHVGYVLRFGSSTRLLVLQGPADDIEPEASESWSQLVAAHSRRKAEGEIRARRIEEEDRLGRRAPSGCGGGAGEGAPGASNFISTGCSWNIDDGEGDEGGVGGGANFLGLLAADCGASCLSHENLYMDDPKKTLKAYFDREGIEPPPEYEFVEGRFGQQMCRLELPLASDTVYAEVPLTGRKRKEAIAACALEACRLLDRLGEFDVNKESAEAARRARVKEYLKTNDYYSSDEDTFLDRTGHVEQRRKKRMKKLGVMEEEDDGTTGVTDTPQQDSLTMLTELEKLGKEIIAVENELLAAEKAMEAVGSNASEMDELEAYMEAIKRGAPNRATRQAFKQRLLALRQEESRLLRKLGIRGKGGVFCSSSSSVSASAVKAAGSITGRQPDDNRNNIESTVEQARGETKLNALKRLLPKVIHQTAPTVSGNCGGDFFPEVDEGEGEASKEQKTSGGDGVSEAKKTKTSRYPFFTLDQTMQPGPSSPTAGPSKSAPMTTEEATIKCNEQTEDLSTEAVSPSEQPPESTRALPHFPLPQPPKVEMGPNQGDHDEGRPVRVGLGNKTSSILSPSPENIIPQDADPVVDYDLMNNPNYALWLPPTDQTGDGMTALNKKYGY